MVKLILTKQINWRPKDEARRTSKFLKKPLTPETESEISESVLLLAFENLFERALLLLSGGKAGVPSCLGAPPETGTGNGHDNYKN